MARSTVQPKVIKTKAPAIDLAGLELAYGWRQYDNVTGLSMAADWYNANIVYLLFGHPLTAEQQKTYDRAVKCARQGQDLTGTTPEEREHFLLTALRLYEKIWTLTTRMTDAVPTRNAESVKTVVDNLNSIFGQFGISYQPATVAEREFNEYQMGVVMADEQGNPTGPTQGYAIRVPFNELLATATKSPLEAALDEVPAVTQMLSVVTRLEANPETGLFDKVAELDGAKFMETLPRVLKGVYTFAAANNARVAKPVGRVAKTGVIKGSVTRTKKWADTAVIHVLRPGNPFTGELAQKYDLIHDGMTVGEFRLKRRKAGLGSGCYPIEAAEKRHYIEVRG